MKILAFLLLTSFLIASNSTVTYSKMSINELLAMRNKIAIIDSKLLAEELNKRVGEMSEEQFLDFANNTIGIIKCEACKDVKY